MKKNILLVFVIILFSFPVILPLFNKGFFQSDDGEWMIIRFSSFYSALRDGQFPVRYLSSLNHGYGYPVANFLYPGFMYLSVPIHILGFGFVDTIKIVLGLSMVGSSVFCFLWISKIFNKFSAFIGSMFYLYFPYHLFDLYKRGSVGEILALAVVPFILWQIERKNFFWISSGIGFLILSHNTLALLLLPAIIFYLFVKKTFTIFISLLVIFLGLGLSSFFSIPAILDLQYTIFSKTKVSEWQNYFAGADIVNYVSLAILCVSLFIAFKNRLKGINILFLVSGLASLFLSTEYSSLVWKTLPISFVQFPFRFLSILILAISYLVSLIIARLKGGMRYEVGAILIILIFISSIQLRPFIFFNKGDDYYSTNEDSTTVRNEYLPVWVKNNPKKHYKNKVEIVNGTISGLKVNPNSINFVAHSNIDTEVTINTIYFPGWKVSVDNKDSEVDYKDDSGLIKFNVIQGVHKITAYFSETPVGIASNVISIASLLILFVITFTMERKKKV